MKWLALFLLTAGPYFLYCMWADEKATAILDSTDFNLPYGLIMAKAGPYDASPQYFLARFGDDNYYGAISSRKMLRLLKKNMVYEALAICERKKREYLNR